MPSARNKHAAKFKECSWRYENKPYRHRECRRVNWTRVQNMITDFTLYIASQKCRFNLTGIFGKHWVTWVSYWSIEEKYVSFFLTNYVHLKHAFKHNVHFLLKNYADPKIRIKSQRVKLRFKTRITAKMRIVLIQYLKWMFDYKDECLD